MTVAAAGVGSLATGAAGGLIVAVAVLDLFLTVFNYDGYTFVSGRYQRGLWRVIRASARIMPRRVRQGLLSIGSAAMLPATFAMWLALEVTGFALMYRHGLSAGGFALKGADASLGAAFYFSAGAISSLTFGDVVARGGLERALVDLETILGLATFTLALGYVVTAFGVLGALENLHGQVRRHAEDLGRPSSILSRHFQGGQSGDLPAFLQSLGDDLETYDQGLRRYPVVYFFHTRRLHRSIPFVFATLGELLALLRWGLPGDEPMTKDPFLAALLDGYSTTLDRLRRNFVGPDPIQVPEPLDEGTFTREYGRSGEGQEGVAAFCALEGRARAAAGAGPDGTDDAYRRYREWFPFAYRQRVVLDRIADALCYERPFEGARL
jgi:hypothetical protein